MPGVFDSKSFNAEVFGKYLETVPRIKQNAMLKAGVLRTRSELKTMLVDQTGGNFITVPMSGRIGGDPLNYDGTTNITADGLDTFLQSIIVVGRMKAWKEKDFTKDITGKDFMEVIAGQVGDYWDDVDQTTILKTLDGIFGVAAFAASNSTDITGAASATDQVAGPTTLNNAIQKAAGANKGIYTLAIVHSQVATNLENLQILSYWKENDENGMQRPVALASWNGRTVLVDDDIPTTHADVTQGVYTVTVGGTVASGDKITVCGKTVTLDATSGASVTAAATAVVTALGTMDEYTITRSSGVITFTEKTGYYGTGAPTASIESTAGTVTVATTTAGVAATNYTSYLLGQGAFDYCDCGAKVPNETWRDPKAGGGEDWLITRQRKVFAPKGFSFVQPSTAIVSPTDAQLATAARWALVKNNANQTYPTKAIPIARIISRG